MPFLQTQCSYISLMHFLFWRQIQQAQFFLIICRPMQRRLNVLDVGPKLYWWYTNVLCLLWTGRVKTATEATGTWVLSTEFQFFFAQARHSANLICKVFVWFKHLFLCVVGPLLGQWHRRCATSRPALSQRPAFAGIINPLTTELFLHTPWRRKGFF